MISSTASVTCSKVSRHSDDCTVAFKQRFYLTLSIISAPACHHSSQHVVNSIAAGLRCTSDIKQSWLTPVHYLPAR